MRTKGYVLTNKISVGTLGKTFMEILHTIDVIHSVESVVEI